MAAHGDYRLGIWILLTDIFMRHPILKSVLVYNSVIGWGYRYISIPPSNDVIERADLSS
ncbi:2150_t:CDS:2 [Rhizophagus irregularis]|nr:2150_t:CDS:2 [Rhizophagus irregularis]